MPLCIPDANVLIGAFRKNAPHHQACADWLRNTGTNTTEIGLCELVEVAFLRICTLPNIQVAPMPLVLQFWSKELWTHASIRRLQPTSSHNSLLIGFINELQLTGNDINDAWLAALAVEHNATLVSLDRGFSRFPGLRWHNPAD
jgi:toxin-antitoxin system PIN domain toxin